MKALTVFKMSLSLLVVFLLIRTLIEILTHYDSLITDAIVMLSVYWLSIMSYMYMVKLDKDLDK